MGYKVQLSRDATVYLRRLDAVTRGRILNRLVELGDDPRQQAKLLKNADGIWSTRVGDYRVLFRIDDQQITVLILTIGPRGQVYRRL